MPRLIDADALLVQFYKDAVRLDGVGAPWDMSGIDLEIKSSPTIDVMEVVRCKDCEHFGNEIRPGRYSCKSYMLPYCKPDDFCSYGEKRTVTDNG